ncbi:MAG: hypothetical protein M1828_003828 [Chrysothrix sp. TS-e1954]|nr:MAG: hypothetical protein M1828_003828 [Chrysothrix sp. TS-e1954]
MSLKLGLAIFAAVLLVSGYLGLAKITIPAIGGYHQSDKGLHFVTFFILTLNFYWIFETTRKRALHLTLLVCVAILSCGSEIIQGLLPNKRDFDPYDVLANIIGSLAALGICQWYHKRMNERKRSSKVYAAVPGDEETGGAGLGDIELGTTGAQEMGVTSGGQSEPNIDRELDNWDENVADDWDEEEPTHANGAGVSKEGLKSPSLGGVEDDTPVRKKRDD